jgi:RNA polymerase sigma-70 factor (ECF subfamily)
MLERLTPDERAALLLHDVFSYRHCEIAATLGRTEEAIRQIVHRARQRIRTGRRRFTVDPRAATALVDRFVNAFEAGDQKELQSVLAADVTQLADGGGVISVGCRPVTGLERVVRLWLGLRAKQFKSCSLAHAKVGGQPGLILRDAAGVMRGVIAIVTDQTSIVSLYVILAPDKVSRAHDRWMASGTLLCSTSSGSA